MKRVLLKLSGEALAGEKKTGFDEAKMCIRDSLGPPLQPVEKSV